MRIAFSGAFVALKGLQENKFRLESSPARFFKMASERSDFFALIIGINKYKEQDDIFPELFGCVPDAESFKQYFQDDLRVPPGNITYLSDAEATRSRILQGFVDLATDPRISQGSAICIYFAGHGATVEAPPGWEAGGTQGKIQAFVPHDCSENPDSPIPSITDLEVAKLINAISEAKGNNITVIFDSCYSASGTRNYLDVEAFGRVRCARRALSHRIHTTSTDDRFLTSERSSTNVISLGQIGLQSHVLLAACKSTEWAYENNNLRGEFSTALLSLLKKTEIYKLRYSDILLNLDKIPRQNPQCEGAHQDRYIFSNTTPGKALTLRVAESGVITLDGGISNGITRGSEFDVFSHISSDVILGQFVADTPNLYNSTGTMTSNTEAGNLIPNQLYFAKQTKSGERTPLRIYTQDPSLAEQLRAHLQTTKPKFANFDIVQLESEAHIAIEKQGNDSARLRVIDPSLDRTRKTVEGYLCHMKNLGAVFQGISFYHWTRDNGGKNVVLRQSVINNVAVEFYKLQSHGQYADIQFSPDSNNLCEIHDGHKQVNLTIDDKSEACYGIKLINKSNYNLFPAVFYFDSDDLSICLYYKSPQTGPNQKPEAPLAACGGTFTIGYGSGGAHPFSFNVPEGQNYDVGLLKIFLFTRPVDVSDFQQGSPFEMTARKEGKPTSDRRGLVWGVIDVSVMQRRQNTDYVEEIQMTV